MSPPVQRAREKWPRALAAFALFGGLGLVVLFGAHVAGLDGPEQARRWLAAAQGPWALPVVVGVFAVLAFVGVPQFALIAAAVAAFGPAWGMAYSWVGTLVSALVGFAIGRAAGAQAIAGVANGGARRFMDLVGRNGFVASLAVRLVPFAPFALVNMAAGVTSMRVAAFTAGTAIGIVPKIALVALAGRSLAVGGWSAWLGLAAAVLVWLGAGLLARRWLK